MILYKYKHYYNFYPSLKLNVPAGGRAVIEKTKENTTLAIYIYINLFMQLFKNSQIN